jgi:hypothetical protein
MWIVLGSGMTRLALHEGFVPLKHLVETVYLAHPSPHQLGDSPKVSESKQVN